MAITCTVILGVNSVTGMTEQASGPSGITHWQTATVVKIMTQTPHIKSFFLEPVEQFAFRAGQHVDLRLTAPDGYRAIRSYSIASAPEDASRIELAIERLDEGEVSPFFHDVVAVGDEIELRGPLGGHFVWSREDGGPLLLIGGGSGVRAPCCYDQASHGGSGQYACRAAAFGSDVGRYSVSRRIA